MSAYETALNFFHACDQAKGWEGCKAYVAPGAAFETQAGALADVKTVEGYCEWMKGLAGLLPDCSYDLHASAWDADNNAAVFVATFSGTHTREGGPVPPTNKRVATDYVYTVSMNADGKVEKLHKTWNDGHALQQLGWA